VRQLRLVQTHLVLADASARRFSLRLVQRQCGLQGRVVESRKHLAFANGHPLLDIHFHELAGNLRRHRCPPPGGDIAGGVEHGGLRAGGSFGDGCRLYLEWLRTRQPAPGCHHGDRRDDHDSDPDDPAPCWTFRLALEAQGGKIVFEISHVPMTPSYMTLADAVNHRCRARGRTVGCAFSQVICAALTSVARDR
jgi:hypothetical protein